MALQVAWRLMFRVNDARAASRSISRVLDILAADVCDGPKPYWKVPALWEVSLCSPFELPAAEGVLGLMLVADGIASGWLIHGPLAADGNITCFEGVFNASDSCRPHIAGLEWASFSLGTFPASASMI